MGHADGDVAFGVDDEPGVDLGALGQRSPVIGLNGSGGDFKVVTAADGIWPDWQKSNWGRQFRTKQAGQGKGYPACPGPRWSRYFFADGGGDRSDAGTDGFAVEVGAAGAALGHAAVKYGVREEG